MSGRLYAMLVREQGGACACGASQRLAVVEHGGALELLCARCRRIRRERAAAAKAQRTTLAAALIACRRFGSRVAEPRKLRGSR